jgi:hypothetical protein
MAETRRRRYFTMPEIDQPDPEPGFQHSSDEFVIPSVDENGDSARCQFRAPGQLLAWGTDICGSKKFPFRTTGDLMRYGFFLACLQLSRIEKAVPSVEANIDAANAVVRRRMAAAAILNHLDHLTESIADLQKKKAWGEISYILAGEKRRAESTLISEPYWGRAWLDGIEERFADVRAIAESKLEFVNLQPSKFIHVPVDGDEEL